MNFFDERTLKKILYTFLGVLLVVTVAVFCFYIWYGNEIADNLDEYSLETQEYNLEDFTKEASSTSDKNVNNVASNNFIVTNNVSSNEVISNSIENKVELKDEKKEKISSSEANIAKEALPKEDKKVEVKKKLEFSAPVDGEIAKDFANETLVYSTTLDEWTTHLGIDIKGAKTSIVKSAEDGIVESIKNDPRYGLTVTIAHQDGFKTVYANLLTTEFVKEGDEVSKGDTIATIGETASFEVLDEPHLHFEMYKDETPVNPTIYLK